MRKSLFPALCLAAILGGCVVAPRPVVYSQPAPVYSGPVMVDHGVPPIEYVEGGVPVYYETEPGVAFYPIFLDTPGSCFCIVPMRYVGGVWLGLGGVVLYRGNFMYHHAPPQHREIWLRSGGEFGGHRPMPGRIEREGNVMRALPPPGSVHAQAVSRQVQGVQPRPQQQGSASPSGGQQGAPNPQLRQQPVQQSVQQPVQQSAPQGRPQPAPASAPPVAQAQPATAPQSRPPQQAATNVRQEHDRKSERKCSKEEHDAKKC